MKNRPKTLFLICLTVAFLAVSGLAAAASLEQPMLIVSIGQSADSQMVRVLAQRNDLTFNFNPVAGPADLAGNKTLAIVIGGSSKGMGAAGVNIAQEDQRGRQLVAAAKAANVKIILLHVGGEQRRGDLTDRFIALLPDCDHAIVVRSGDKDGAFTKAAGGKVPLTFTDNIAAVGPALKSLF